MSISKLQIKISGADISNLQKAFDILPIPPEYTLTIIKKKQGFYFIKSFPFIQFGFTNTYVFHKCQIKEVNNAQSS